MIDLWPYVYREAFPWSLAFLERSARAVAVRKYAAHVVPGLLQTEAYARAVLSVGRTLQSEEHLAERVEARMQRQERLAERDRPELWMTLDESVLWRPIGGPGVMRRQPARLLDAARDRHTTIQILPSSRASTTRSAGR